ncbi:MFS transporter [Kineococcus rubinsiae]|uniref:MFS transporter n=1 Tax=Kineococcus rubinsiae TaxID=2609562 RepID=UPI00143039C6|nr:MFS transporter [Kineococcus rubinsiae]NIZ92420.1 MFS transporter [Kineococcus rubinsiae]
MSTRPVRLPPATGFWAVAATLTVLLAASAAPSPLFPVYEDRWGLGPTAVTLVFAVYAATLLLTLLTAGSLSDHLGRRPVALAGVLGVVAATVLFTRADSVGWLLAARALQGVSTGAAIGSLGAALLDLQRPGRQLAQLVNGAAPPVGLTLGALGSGLLVQFAPAPTRLVYVVFAALLLLCAAALWFLPSTAERVPGALASLRPTVAVPAATRPALLHAAPAFVGSWALGGLYLSLGPSLAAQVLGRGDHLVGGLVVASVAGVGALVGVLSRHADAARVVALGSAAFVVGPLLLVVALEQRSTAGFFLGAALSGVGFGAGFQGALRTVLATAPAAGRAGVLSAVYVLSYLAFGVPAVVAGLLAPTTGLERATDGYSALVVVLGVLGLVLAGRAARSARAQRVRGGEPGLPPLPGA